MSFIGIIILKDFRDVIGDAKFGKRTFLVRHGNKVTCIIAGGASTIGSMMLAVFYFRTNHLFAGLLIGVLILVLRQLQQLSLQPTIKKQLLTIGSIGKLGNGALLAILVLESNRTLHHSKLLLDVLLVIVLAMYIYYSKQNKRGLL